jgi:hypothetical protein
MSLNTTIYLDVKKENTTTCFGTWPNSGWILLDFQRENAFGNVLLICHDGGGETRSRFTKSGVFWGVLGVAKFWCSSASMVSSG